LADSKANAYLEELRKYQESDLTDGKDKMTRPLVK